MRLRFPVISPGNELDVCRENREEKIQTKPKKKNSPTINNTVSITALSIQLQCPYFAGLEFRVLWVQGSWILEKGPGMRV